MNTNWMLMWSLVFAVLLAACGGHEDTKDTAANVVTKKLSHADIVTLKPQTFEQTIAFTGSLMPLKQATVSAESGGTVAQLLVDEGVQVSAGQILAVLDNQNMRQNAQSQKSLLENSRANLALANTKLKQQQVLFEKGFVSRLALEQAQNEHQVALGNYRSQEAELAKINKNVADEKVKAPIDGVVYEKLVNAGELLAAGAQVLKIAQTDVLEIAATVSSEQVTFVKVGQLVRFSVAAGAPEQEGRIVRINPVANDATRQFTVFIKVNNPEGVLKVGQFAQGKIILQQQEQALVVPSLAIRMDQEQAFVYVIEKGQVAKRDIKVVLQDALNGMAMVDGLQSGDVILRAEMLGVQTGDAVTLPQARQ